MADFRPTYITFDCYGTLIDFHMSDMTRPLVQVRRTRAFPFNSRR
jgi:FMN phosphatase YigB (HAD superfamily)